MHLLWLFVVLDLLSPTRQQKAIVIMQLKPVLQILVIQLLLDELQVEMPLRIVSLHRRLLEVTLGQSIFEQVLTRFGRGVGAQEIGDEAIR